MRKSERLHLSITRAEKTAAESLAEAEGGLSMAAMIRRLIRNAARQPRAVAARPQQGGRGSCSWGPDRCIAPSGPRRSSATSADVG